MLKLSLPKIDIWDDKTEEFKELGGQTVELEHSLYTVAAWEAKWKTEFANKKGLTREQLLDYITTFMCQTPEIPKSAWLTIDQATFETIRNYMEDSQTATKVRKLQNMPGSGRQGTITAELIYFYMTQFNIPPEYEHWHLNRLLTLLDVCAAKSAPPKKMGRREAAQMQAAQNAALRAKLGSRG